MNPIARANLNFRRRTTQQFARRVWYACWCALLVFGLLQRRQKNFYSRLGLSDSSECPTTNDVLDTPGSSWFQAQVWRDTACSTGCVLPCFRKAVPCCVVRKATGLLNQAIQLCIGQVDGGLMKKIRKNGLKVLKYCQNFTRLQFRIPNCNGLPERVPRVVHTISGNERAPAHIRASVLAEKGFTIHHVSDKRAISYIQANCSSILAETYQCIKPPAFRADLYRFCVLYAVGGVYLDADLMPLVSLRELYSPCSTFTLGYDQVQGDVNISNIGMQMKILAAAPQSNIAKCMLDRIAENVRLRRHFNTPLEFSGPQLLRKCYLDFSDDVAVTYMDTRGAAWPYSGLRMGPKILAYEKPEPTRHFEEIRDRLKEAEYNDMMKRRDIYTKECSV